MNGYVQSIRQLVHRVKDDRIRGWVEAACTVKDLGHSRVLGKWLLPERVGAANVARLAVALEERNDECMIHVVDVLRAVEESGGMQFDR